LDRLLITVVGVVGAIVVSGIVFVGANKVFDLAPRRWSAFSTVIGATTMLAVFGLLWGNRLIDQPVAVTVVATLIGGATGFALSQTSSQRAHFVIGSAAGAAVGLLAGIFLKAEYWPSLNLIGLAIAVGGFLAVGLSIWGARGRRTSVVRPVLLWGSLGWVAGAFLYPALGSGTQGWAIAAATILGVGFGTWVGSFPLPDQLMRADIALGSRKYIFLIPALGFILMTLVIPLIRTIWMSMLTGLPKELTWVGFQNYIDIVKDPGIIDFSNWTDMFTSRLFIIGMLALAAALIVALISGRQTGRRLGVNGGSLTAVVLGAILVGFAFFTVVRGTISNNLWWIFAVTIFSTGAGLAIAVLTDRAKGESVAKSFIFMPMAISFVGASIIWRFMYVARPPTKDQTGVLNALWVKIGEWSNSSTASTVVLLILAGILIGLLYLAYAGRKAHKTSVVAGAVVAAVPIVWLMYRFLGPGLGGYVEVQGQIVANPILFITEAPFNNWWLMVVLIWIQTGFAMVILSAAIKGVPSELLEAAAIDGATESQVFWRVTVPQIGPTIGVVMTTLVVVVLKVFDIPKVMTNGNFDTQVLANEMWQRAFTELNFGLGSALAVVIFLGVLPVMWLNIRRMQQQRVSG
jgi:ABC-type sugar transport system permease subunit